MIPTSFDEFINDPLFGIYLLCLVLVLIINIFKVILPLNRLRIECGLTFSEIRQERRASKAEEKRRRDEMGKKDNQSDEVPTDSKKAAKEIQSTKIGSLKKLLRGPSRNKNNENKIKVFLIYQIVIILLPLFSAILVRIMLGDPQEVPEWGLLQILISAAVFSLWTLWNGYNANQFSKLIKPYLTKPQKRGVFSTLDPRQYHPKRNRESLFLMIGITNFSRRNLKWLSEIQPPEYTKHEELELEPLMIEDEYGGRSQINTRGIIENAGKIGKRVSNTITNTLQFGKGVTKQVSRQLTAKINEHIESKVSKWTDSNIWPGLIQNLAIVFIPIVTIYCVPLI